MNEHGNQSVSPASVSDPLPPSARNQHSTIKIEAAPMAHSLVHPDVMFPPIPDGELADGRTKAGKAQRKYLVQREAYLAAWEMAHSYEEVTFRNLRELMRERRLHQNSIDSLRERVSALTVNVGAAGTLSLVCFQLGILFGGRPEHIVQSTSSSGGVVLNFEVSGVSLSVIADEQHVTVDIPGMKNRQIAFDADGNFTEGSILEFVGYLQIAGVTVSRDNVKLMLSMAKRAKLFDDGHTVTADMIALSGLTAYTRTMRNKPRTDLSVGFGDQYRNRGM